jgi:hypothetical protein
LAFSAFSRSSGGYCFVPLVTITPGAIALTRMPWSAHSTASVFVMLSTPARAAPVCTMPGNPRMICAMTLTIRPRFCGIIALLATAWVMPHVPIRLLRITAAKPFGESASAVVGNCPPALLMRTSMRPKRSSTESTYAVIASGSRMSQGAPNASMPLAPSSATAFFKGSRRLPQIATLAPKRPISVAETRPIPVPPPVIKTTSSKNSPSAYT